MDSPTSPSDYDITSVLKIVKDYEHWSGSYTKSADQSDLFSSFNRTASLESSSRKRSFAREKTASSLSKEERTELVAAKAKVAKLEKDLKASEREHQYKLIEDETRLKLASSRLARDQEECDNMRRKFKSVVEQKESKSRELEDLKKKYQELANQFANEQNDWTREKDQLKTRLNDVHDSSISDVSGLQEKCQSQTLELMNLKNKLEEVEIQNREYQSRQEESRSLCADYNEVKYRCNVAENKVKHLQEQLSQRDEAALISQKSQQELCQYRELERDNKRLKDENRLLRDGEEKMLVMQEKLSYVKSKLEKAETTVKRLRSCEFENEELKEKLAQYSDRPKSEGELTRMISELQTSYMNSSERNGELEVSVSILDASLIKKIEDLKKLEETTTDLQTRNANLDDKYTKLQRRLTLVTSERDGLRRVLSSYEAEDGKSAKIKIEESESRAASLQKMHDELESRFDAMATEHKELKSKVADDARISSVSMKETIELKEYRKQMVELRKDVERMKEEKLVNEALLEKRELQGVYDPRKTKVLHLKNNIMQSAYDDYAKEIEDIREENERLRKKVVRLEKEREEGGGDPDDTFNMSRLIKTSKPMEELKKAYESEKKQRHKIVEQFANTAKGFREAIHEIFGYRFQLTKTGVYRVQSIFSPCEDDFFMFKCAKNNEGLYQTGMIQTEYSNQWMSLFNEYIVKGDSIPAFLAAISLDLFSQNTEVRDLTLAQKARQT